MCLLHFLKELPCPGDYLCRQACQLRYVHAVALVYSAPDYLAQEANCAAVFVYGDAEVLYALQLVLQSDELVIVSREKGLAAQLLRGADVLRYCPCYADSVKGGGSPSHLVQNDQTGRRCVFQYVGDLAHLHHEGGLACGKVVGGSHSGEYLIHYGYPCGIRRHEAAYLRHEHDKGGLAHICGYVSLGTNISS